MGSTYTALAAQVLQAALATPMTLVRSAYLLVNQAPLISIGLRVVRVFPVYFVWDAPLHIWRVLLPVLSKMRCGHAILRMMHVIMALYLTNFLLGSFDSWLELTEDLRETVAETAEHWLPSAWLDSFYAAPKPLPDHPPSWKASVFRRFPLPFSLVSHFMELDISLLLDETLTETFGRSVWWAFFFAPVYLYLLRHPFKVDGQHPTQDASPDAFFPLDVVEKHLLSEQFKDDISAGIESLTESFDGLVTVPATVAPAAWARMVPPAASAPQGTPEPAAESGFAAVLHQFRRALFAVISWFLTDEDEATGEKKDNQPMESK